MKSITRAFSALVVVGTVLASTSAFAASPREIANEAYENGLSTTEAIEAAGKESTPELRSRVNFFLNGLDNTN